MKRKKDILANATRQDAIGTPFCITIDYDSIANNDVTIRYRDSMEQKRIKVEELHGLLVPK